MYREHKGGVGRQATPFYLNFKGRGPRLCAHAALNYKTERETFLAAVLGP